MDPRSSRFNFREIAKNYDRGVKRKKLFKSLFDLLEIDLFQTAMARFILAERSSHYTRGREIKRKMAHRRVSLQQYANTVTNNSGLRRQKKKPGENYHSRPREHRRSCAPKILGTREKHESQIRAPTHTRYRRYTIMERCDALERYSHTNAFICRVQAVFVGHRREIIFLPRRAKQKYGVACRR